MGGGGGGGGEDVEVGRGRRGGRNRKMLFMDTFACFDMLIMEIL